MPEQLLLQPPEQLPWQAASSPQVTEQVPVQPSCEHPAWQLRLQASQSPVQSPEQLLAQSYEQLPPQLSHSV